MTLVERIAAGLTTRDDAELVVRLIDEAKHQAEISVLGAPYLVEALGNIKLAESDR